MTKELDREVSQYLAYNKFNNVFLTLLGWSNTHSGAAYRFLPYIYLCINMSMAYFVFMFVRVHCTSILLITRGLTLMAGFCINVLKMACFIKYKQEIFELREILEIHVINLLEQNRFTRLILNEMARYRFLSFGLFASILICNIIFNVLPLSKIISNHIHHIQSDHYILPYPTLFPWPVPFDGLIFGLHFFYETIASIAVFILAVGTDSIFIFFIFLMVAQLREISYSITHINEKTDSRVVLKKCMIQYCTIIRCCTNLEKIYGPIILCLMTTNAIMLCTLTYQITQMKTLTILKGVSFFLYITVKVIQTYMYSWCGTHLTMESEEFRSAIYAANWYGDKSFMTAIIIMLQQRPLVLTACSFSNVSIDIFTKILNTTISYYFLLKTIEQS